MLYRLVVHQVQGWGGSEFTVLVGVAALAATVAVGDVRRRGLLAGAATVIVALMLDLSPLPASPTRNVAVAGMAPALVCIPWLMWHLQTRRDQPPPRSLVVGRARMVEVIVLTMAVLFWSGIGSMPSPVGVTERTRLATAEITPEPVGWDLLATVEKPAVSAIFGPGSTWTRTYWVADTDRADIATAPRGTPRRIVVDDVRVPDVGQLAITNLAAQYDLVGWSRSPAVDMGVDADARVDLVAAVQERIADVSLAATFVGVDVRLPDGGGQRIVVIALDDHRATAPFPPPGRGLPADARATAGRLLRGDEAMTFDPELATDRDLLAAVMRDLLHTPSAAS